MNKILSLPIPKNLKRGVVNIINLANADFCVFIATKNLENPFKGLGKMNK